MLLFMRGALFLGGGRIVVAPSWIEVKEHGQGYCTEWQGLRVWVAVSIFLLQV